MASRRSTRSTTKKVIKSPNGMVNGLKTKVIEGGIVSELNKICEENFKIPKELDINSNQRMFTANGCGDSPVSNEQPMVEEDERVRKKRKVAADSEKPSTSFLDSSQNSSKKKTPSPRMDNLCEQLVQALQSNDEDLLDNVLNDRTAEEMTNTTNNIPGEYIQPFLEHLKRRIYTKSTSNISHLIWLEKLLQTRLSLLLTLPNTRSELTSLLDALTIRTEVLQKVIALRGMMNLIMSQVSSKPIVTPMRERKALREFNDSSDDDDSDGDEVNYQEHDEDEESNNEQAEADGQSEEEEMSNSESSDDDDEELD